MPAEQAAQNFQRLFNQPGRQIQQVEDDMYTSIDQDSHSHDLNRSSISDVVQESSRKRKKLKKGLSSNKTQKWVQHRPSDQDYEEVEQMLSQGGVSGMIVMGGTKLEKYQYRLRQLISQYYEDHGVDWRLVAGVDPSATATHNRRMVSETGFSLPTMTDSHYPMDTNHTKTLDSRDIQSRDFNTEQLHSAETRSTATGGVGYVIPPSQGSTPMAFVGYDADGNEVKGEAAAEQLPGVKRDLDGSLRLDGREVVGLDVTGEPVFALPLTQREKLAAKTGADIIGVDSRGRLVTSSQPKPGTATDAMLGADHVVGLVAGGMPLVLHHKDGGEVDEKGRVVVATTTDGDPIYAATSTDLAKLPPAVAQNIIGIDKDGEPVFKPSGASPEGLFETKSGLTIAGIDATGRAVCAIDPDQPDMLPPGTVVDSDRRAWIKGREVVAIDADGQPVFKLHDPALQSDAPDACVSIIGVDVQGRPVFHAKSAASELVQEQNPNKLMTADSMAMAPSTLVVGIDESGMPVFQVDQEQVQQLQEQYGDERDVVAVTALGVPVFKPSEQEKEEVPESLRARLLGVDADGAYVYTTMLPAQAVVPRQTLGADDNGQLVVSVTPAEKVRLEAEAAKTRTPGEAAKEVIGVKLDGTPVFAVTAKELAAIPPEERAIVIGRDANGAFVTSSGEAVVPVGEIKGDVVGVDGKGRGVFKTTVIGMDGEGKPVYKVTTKDVDMGDKPIIGITSEGVPVYKVNVNSDSVLLPPGVFASDVIGIDATGKIITAPTPQVVEKGNAAVVGIDATGRIVKRAQDVPVAMDVDAPYAGPQPVDSSTREFTGDVVIGVDQDGLPVYAGTESDVIQPKGEGLTMSAVAAAAGATGYVIAGSRQMEVDFTPTDGPDVDDSFSEAGSNVSGKRRGLAKMLSLFGKRKSKKSGVGYTSDGDLEGSDYSFGGRGQSSGSLPGGARSGRFEAQKLAAGALSSGALASGPLSGRRTYGNVAIQDGEERQASGVATYSMGAARPRAMTNTTFEVIGTGEDEIDGPKSYSNLLEKEGYDAWTSGKEGLDVSVSRDLDQQVARLDMQLLTPEEEIAALLTDHVILKECMENGRFVDMELTPEQIDAIRVILEADSAAQKENRTGFQNLTSAEIQDMPPSKRLVKQRAAAQDPAVLLAYSKLPFSVRKAMISNVKKRQLVSPSLASAHDSLHADGYQPQIPEDEMEVQIPIPSGSVERAVSAQDDDKITSTRLYSYLEQQREYLDEDAKELLAQQDKNEPDAIRLDIEDSLYIDDSQIEPSVSGQMGASSEAPTDLVSLKDSEAAEYVAAQHMHMRQFKQSKYFEQAEHLSKVMSAMRDTRGLQMTVPNMPTREGEVVAHMPGGGSMLSAIINIYKSGSYQADQCPSRLYLEGGREFYIQEDCMMKSAYDALTSAFGSFQQIKRENMVARQKARAAAAATAASRPQTFAKMATNAPKPPPLPKSKRLMRSISALSTGQGMQQAVSAAYVSPDIHNSPRRDDKSVPNYMKPTASSIRRTISTQQQRQEKEIARTKSSSSSHVAQSMRYGPTNPISRRQTRAYPMSMRESGLTLSSAGGSGTMNRVDSEDKPPWRPSGAVSSRSIGGDSQPGQSGSTVGTSFRRESSRVGPVSSRNVPVSSRNAPVSSRNVASGARNAPVSMRNPTTRQNAPVSSRNASTSSKNEPVSSRSTRKSTATSSREWVK